jgi:hypothetical protein
MSLDCSVRTVLQERFVPGTFFLSTYVAFLAPAIFVSAYLFVGYRIAEHLRREHHWIYTHLGRPDISEEEPSWEEAWKLERFLCRREYLGLGDPQLNKLAWWSRPLAWLSVVSVSCAVLFWILAMN